jgi:two-component system sensor histidine kinase SenX3
VRRTGKHSEVEVEPARSRLVRLPDAVRVRVVPVGDSGGHVALLVEDVTEARRVEAVRRDFVANVSHELKTPVGRCRCWPRRCRTRARTPARSAASPAACSTRPDRLARLVQELIDLSRLQGADPLPDASLVPVDKVVAEAVDRTRTAASAAASRSSRRRAGLTVSGSESQLVTAVGTSSRTPCTTARSAPGSAVAVRSQDGAVEISVTDQGMGIAEKELERVFERFYRADPRARAPPAARASASRSSSTSPPTTVAR